MKICLTKTNALSKQDWLAKNYLKPSSDILRTVGGKIGKPKHSNVINHGFAKMFDTIGAF